MEQKPKGTGGGAANPVIFGAEVKTHWYSMKDRGETPLPQREQQKGILKQVYSNTTRNGAEYASPHKFCHRYKVESGHHGEKGHKSQETLSPEVHLDFAQDQGYTRTTENFYTPNGSLKNTK